MIQCGLDSGEMLLIIPSLISFEIEHYEKNKCVQRNHDATALCREKCFFRRIIFICKGLHSNYHLHICFLNLFFIMDATLCGIQVFAWRKYIDVFISLLLSSLSEYHCKAVSHRWSLIISSVRLQLLLHFLEPQVGMIWSLSTLCSATRPAHTLQQLLFGQITWVGNFPVSEIMEGWSSDSV